MEFLRKGHELEDAYAMQEYALELYSGKQVEGHKLLIEKFLTACQYIVCFAEEQVEAKVEKEQLEQAKEEYDELERDREEYWLK